MDQGGSPVLLALRLKIDGGKISEIETITVHNADEGMLFAPQDLDQPSAAMNYVPTATERNSRADLIRIADGYPSGLKIGSFPRAGAKIATDAYRFENGMRMAGKGCTLQPPSCENMLEQ